MCRRTTVRRVGVSGLGIGVLALLPTLGAQSGPTGGIGWRHVGNSAMELALPSLATGAVDRVWYSSDGSSLFARTASGRVFQTSDFEQWRLVIDPKVIPPSEETPAAPTAPEVNFKLASRASAGHLYGIGQDAYRSDDDGESWFNLTSYKGKSVLGPGL